MYVSLFTKTLMALVLLFSVSVASAAGTAMIDVNRIVDSIPQKQQIENALKSEFGGRFEDLKRIETEIKGLLEKDKRDGDVMSSQERTDLRSRIQTLDTEYKTKGQALSEDNRRRQLEERNKLMASIKAAVAKVAQANGYEAVIESSVTAYILPGRDISDQVIAELKR